MHLSAVQRLALVNAPIDDSEIVIRRPLADGGHEYLGSGGWSSLVAARTLTRTQANALLESEDAEDWEAVTKNRVIDELMRQR